MELGNRVALVTGAGQGVGRGIALALGAAGARVVVLGRTRSKLDAVTAELRAAGADALAIVADATNRMQIRAALSTVSNTWGRLDVLVNSAYEPRVGMFDELTAEDAREDWTSGFAGPLRCMQESFELLRATNGCVVNIGAATGLKPDTTTFSFYASTKEALRSLTRTAAMEWGPHGVRVNMVIPLAKSPAFDLWGEEHPEEYRINLASIPLKYLGDPQHDVGPGVVFLASDDAHYLTGTTLMLDGGRGYLR
ncbi:MAG TPA: SDR family oxidoreductase [Acidimicrobiales bacterium]|nr:SDR family oxidoreductase [Acidimicrobiales bacterium]